MPYNKKIAEFFTAGMVNAVACMISNLRDQTIFREDAPKELQKLAKDTQDALFAFERALTGEG